LTPAVEVLGAEKTYANGTQALLPVNLAVAEGAIVTLLGPSGCGKSTLLNLVAGLLQPTSGRVLRWGQPAGDAGHGARSSPRLGYVFQQPTLMPWASVLANVRLPLDLAHEPHEPRAASDERVRAALKLVGLERFEQALPRELSGGMQMRASIARSLVTQPQLLLMDEPFGALDEITRNRLDGDLLGLWAARKLTVMFVTHSIHEAVFLSQRVLVMAARPGRVVEEVQIDEPYPRAPEFRVSTRFSQHAQRLQQALLAASSGADEALA
jgi:NitT/TauT family transport system ATP-binding protein